MKRNSYEQALKYIYATSPNRPATKQQQDYSLDRIVKLLNLLGNPQDTFKSIHIAGTSGKGSTATILSILLRSQGFKIGLTLSPHIIDIRERVQINNSLLTEDKFARYFAEILPYIKTINSESTFPISFFEMMIALAYYSFAKEKVDYAVIETGLGGTLDATNTIRCPDKLCIITKIGLDHTQILGSTLPLIAAQKAGIIHNKNVVITCDQDKNVMPVFIKQCKRKNAIFNLISAGKTYTQQAPSRFAFSYKGLKLNNVKLGMQGDFQIENAALALTALKILSDRDAFKLNTDKVLQILEICNYPARFDVFKLKNKHLIIDGAHNPQKMKALIQSLISLFPECKFDFYIAFKYDKDYLNMIRQIMPLASRIFVSSYIIKNVDVKVVSVPAKILMQNVQNLGFSNVKIIKQSEIYSTILENNINAVITGSLYFISELYVKNNDFRNMKSAINRVN